MQNCQKIKLYGSLTTKELKKKHSSRLVGGWKQEDKVERMQQGSSWWEGAGKAATGRPSYSPFMCGWAKRNNWGTTQTTQPRVPAWGNKAWKPLAVKTCGVCGGGNIPSLTRKYFGETHRILECTQAHPPGNQHLKGHNLLVGSERSDWKWVRAKQAALFALWPLPHRQHHNAEKWVALPWLIPKALPLTM